MEENCNVTNCPGIYNYADLVAFWEALNKRKSLEPWQDEKGVINLWNNIDLKGLNIPYSNDFNGVFDGNCHVLSGVKLEGGSYCALFDRLGVSGVVKNLEVIGSINTTGSYSGLVGINRGLIQNCSFRGDHNGPGYLGGIAGFNEGSGKIIECKYTGNISNGTGYCSGITGLNRGAIIACQVNCAIQSSGYTGLITGLNEGTISGCTCSGIVFCTECYCGGITGYNRGDISGCDCSCKIFGQSDASKTNFDIGGIAGINGGNIKCCTFTGQIECVEHGGIVGINWKLVDSCLCEKLITSMDNACGGGIVGRNGDEGVVINCHNELYISKSKNYGRVAYNNQRVLTNCSWRGCEKEKGVVQGDDSTLRLDIRL
ncbi:hypothetical protein [uncultured Parabacteroides sp.]|uniref:hypothetical protein n=1 Tax=uncultured Parabacteroides sp. TaxID=512312 RepID=UPI0025927914|nr:hypothetical protein [uncultured Parabacteroides sp.]